MTPRVVAQRRPQTSFEEYRRDGEYAAIESKAFWSYALAPSLGIEGGDVIEMLPAEEQRVLSKAASGGGFLVPTDVADMVISASRTAGAVAQVAQEFITERGETLTVGVGGTHGTAAWTAESASYTPSDETVTSVGLGAYKSTSKLIASEELRTDSAIALDAYIANEMGQRLGVLQEAAFISGDGSGKPTGLLDAASAISIVTAATGSTVKYTVADLLAVWKQLPAAYRPNASWIVSADDYGTLAGTADTAGGLVFPSLQGQAPALFGRPVFISPSLPSPAANAKSLILGDFKTAYGIRRVNGISLQRQDELHSDSGHVGYKAYARVDGKVLLADAARVLAHSAS